MILVTVSALGAVWFAVQPADLLKPDPPEPRIERQRGEWNVAPARFPQRTPERCVVWNGKEATFSLACASGEKR